MNNAMNTNTNPIGATPVPSTPMPPTGTVMPTVTQASTTPVDTVVVPPQVPPAPPVVSTAPVTAPIPPKKKSHKAGIFIFLLLVIIGGMGYYIYKDYLKDKETECSPLVTSDTSLRRLELDSTVVQDLYQKIATSVREDLAYNTFDDKLKLYLAFRQISQSKIYDSNCNLFNTSMLPFTCEESTEFAPKAFKEETMQLELKKMFGEKTEIANANVQLGSSCFGGYQYIKERGEYVQGYCKEISTTIYNVEKELVEATVQGDTIVLREKVRYYSSEGIDSDKLQSGVYVHTFKLDNNYNYAYVSRSVEAS